VGVPSLYLILWRTSAWQNVLNCQLGNPGSGHLPQFLLVVLWQQQQDPGLEGGVLPGVRLASVFTLRPWKWEPWPLTSRLAESRQGRRSTRLCISSTWLVVAAVVSIPAEPLLPSPLASQCIADESRVKRRIFKCVVLEARAGAGALTSDATSLQHGGKA